MRSANYKRVSAVCLALMAAAAVPILWGSDQGVRTMFNAPLLWIPRDADSRQELNRFLSEFRSHEIALVSWPDCTVDDPRAQEVESRLIASRDQRQEAGQPKLFHDAPARRAMISR